jgi:hypothetical protein
VLPFALLVVTRVHVSSKSIRLKNFQEIEILPSHWSTAEAGLVEQSSDACSLAADDVVLSAHRG